MLLKQGMELTLRNHTDDPNALQDAFWGFPSSVSLPVKDLGNGRYLIMGHLAGEGQYDISIKVGGKHIMESPVRFTVSRNFSFISYWFLSNSMLQKCQYVCCSSYMTAFSVLNCTGGTS